MFCSPQPVLLPVPPRPPLSTLFGGIPMDIDTVWKIHSLPPCGVRATRAEHSRRFLRLNYAIEWVTTHLQEIPQRIR